MQLLLIAMESTQFLFLMVQIDLKNRDNIMQLPSYPDWGDEKLDAANPEEKKQPLKIHWHYTSSTGESIIITHLVINWSCYL